MHDIQPVSRKGYSTRHITSLSFRDSLVKMAMEKHASLIEEDDTSLATSLTGIAVEQIISQCHWRADQLSKNHQYAVWFVMLAISERICRLLDASPKLVSMYAALWVFRNNPDYQFGSMVKEMKSHYINRQSDADANIVFVLLNRHIDNWLFNCDLSKTRQIARVADMLAGSSISNSA